MPLHDIRAVRGYWRGVRGLGPRFEFIFAGEVAPGYAWIFPASSDTANIGVGLFDADGMRSRRPAHLLERLLTSHPRVAARLQRAERVGPVRGYPLRTDFPSHPVHGHGWLLVGEAAGLVNPVTGEGIDLALESAELAAWAVDRALRAGDPGVAARASAQSAESHATC
ncbi:MAG TPA: hypothetical protein EYP04_01125 [Anaerolineae bacterium]|nr:hypothetical protein [Anaerolineae bacterium]HIQ05710.1 hypothetical protein [Anaerolineae bacterium]